VLWTSARADVVTVVDARTWTAKPFTSPVNHFACGPGERLLISGAPRGDGDRRLFIVYVTKNGGSSRYAYRYDATVNSTGTFFGSPTYLDSTMRDLAAILYLPTGGFVAHDRLEDAVIWFDAMSNVVGMSAAVGDVNGVLVEVEGAVVYALANAILSVPSRGSVRCLTRPLCAPVAIAPASGREIAVRDGCNGDVVLLRADDGAVTARVRARASVVLHVRTQ
jgi:hypothetical protein